MDGMGHGNVAVLQESFTHLTPAAIARFPPVTLTHVCCKLQTKAYLASIGLFAQQSPSLLFVCT
jgi:hypothetical protein